MPPPLVLAASLYDMRPAIQVSNVGVLKMNGLEVLKPGFETNELYF
jgi:hypothetical protein